MCFPSETGMNETVDHLSRDGVSTVFFGVSPTDLTTMVAATGVLADAARLARSVPAWRAARGSSDVVARRCD